MTTTLAPERESIPGWFHHGSKILELVEHHRPKVCVELGTWQGASAIPVALSVRRWGGTVACIDTWGGELDDDGGSVEGAPPLMLLGCARRMVDMGVGANVRLIPALTTEAAKYWTEPIDFLYIDADHGYEGVKADLHAWVPHVKPGGLILGDDYGNPYYKGVREAWDEFEFLNDLNFQKTEPNPAGVQLIYGVKP